MIVLLFVSRRNEIAMIRLETKNFVRVDLLLLREWQHSLSALPHRPFLDASLS
jgi:hypothetical protein